MALSEDQIVRYSRQILLTSIGGAGQEKLLAAAVTLVGSGAAQGVAASYLAASGVGIRRLEAADEGGFTSNTAGLDDQNPDALDDAGRSLVGQLGESPSSFEGDPPWVAVGWDGECAVVLWCSQTGCLDCFGENHRALTPGRSDALSVEVGALAALAFQRLVLGLGSHLGGVCVAVDGAVTPRALRHCERCSGGP